MSSSSPWLQPSEAEALSQRVHADYGILVSPSDILALGSFESLIDYIDGLLAQQAAEGVAPKPTKIERTWALSPETSVLLRDHVVCGRYVFPTDGYLELLAQALDRGIQGWRVEQLRLAHPLVIDTGESCSLCLWLEPFEDGYKFQFQSQGSTSSVTHASGAVRLDSAALAGTARHWAILDNADRRLESATIYQPGDSRFGPFYQNIREIRIRGQDAVAILHCTSEAQVQSGEYLTAPALLDAALVTALSLARMRDTEAGASPIYLPVLLEGIRIPAPILVHAAFALAEHLESDAEGSIFRVTLIDDDNQVLFLCDRLHARRFHADELGVTQPSDAISPDRVAIIGMSCRFPQADSVAEFWENIRTGRDCIQPVPPDRWDIESVYHPDKGTLNKTYSRVGGFLRDVDRFDPLFFGIAPTEAEVMDPQQRLFLLESWKALEDAGYSEERLSGQRCGVFVGASTGDYMHLLDEVRANSSEAFTGLATSILASRVSYYLNLIGPSVSLDTACSSSLVAVRQAISSLESGDCEIALAGGIALLLTPDLHIKTCKTGMLSPQGNCRSFDAAADGIVLGEGVGVVVLKPLQAALRDGDRIYAVIRGAQTNQDGRTNGITAPSGVAQRQLLTSVYHRAGIDPTSISLLEAHGTGTALGDAVELDALLSVFPAQAEAYCSLTSVKSQIGHTTLAAGIASLIKTTLSLHHRTLPPMLHFERSSEAGQLERTPFRIDHTARPWVSVPPRCAGISSFGFSGTNCHIVLEEAPAVERIMPPVREQELVVVSAKSSGALQRKIADLIAWVDLHRQDYSLYAVASMLAHGRSHFRKRAAFVCQDWNDLLEQLKSADLSVPSGTGALAEVANQYLAGDNAALLELYPRASHQVFSMPAYPFERKRYWLQPARLSSKPVGDREDKGESPAQPTTYDHTQLAPQNPIQLHPFSERERVGRGMRFILRLTGEEQFFTNHVVAGQRMLPGVCLLEFAWAAVSEMLGQPVRQLMDVRWLAPVRSTEQGITLQITVELQTEGAASFTITQESAWTPVVCCTGSASNHQRSQTQERIDLGTLRDGASRQLAGAEFYGYAAGRGLQLGPLFQSIESLHYGTDYTLGRLQGTATAGGLQIGLLDGVLQTALAGLDGTNSGLSLPYTLTRLELFAAVPNRGWAYATRLVGVPDAFAIALCYEDGRSVLQMHGFTVRSVLSEREMIRAGETWETISEPERLKSSGPLLVFTATESNTVAANWDSPAAIVHADSVFRRLGPREWGIDPHDREHYSKLLDELGSANLTPDVVLHEWTSEASRNLFCLVQALPQKPCRIVHRSDGLPASIAVAGLARSIALETPGIAMKSVQGASSEQLLVELCAPADGETQIRYVNGKRQVRRWREIQQSTTEAVPLRRGGVYLLTGGTGKIAQVLSERLRQEWDAKVVLLSRQPSCMEGASLLAVTVDVTQPERVREAIKQARLRFGQINGVFHLAGEQRDALLTNKTVADFDRVMAPKVEGVTALDQALANDPLDFFVVFSSIAAAFGNRGQSDYAAANRYLDAWAGWREEQRRMGRRSGVTRSVNWSLWADGAMQPDAASNQMALTAGFHPLPTEQAWQALLATLAGQETVSVVLYGDGAKLRRLLVAPTAKPVWKSVAISSSRLEAELVATAAAILKVETEELDTTVNLSEYGFHSINITGLANQINQRYDLEITPATLFEYPTLEALAGYLSTVHQDQLTPQVAPRPSVASSISRNEAIAIIGLSGRMPQAEDLNTFWQHLRDGRDCISEIPSDRWNWRDYLGEAADGSNCTNVRWGAFLPQVDRFDPLLFGISPREAACMDPQQRILLECVWEALEDSGTAPSALAGSKTGIFVGVSTSDYADLMRERANGMATHGSTGVSHCILANRISYWLDIHGQSEPIDTACSSALVAVHRAVEAIRSGQCESALVGGVNVILNPTLFISFDQAGMLSPEGICRPFAANANGYVRGEGAGILFLKPLSAALRDGNPIYGLIRGTAVNHGGRASSLTAPNPNAQAALLLEAFENAQINPWDLGYVEAHGTGTPLGDPIEVNALRKAYELWSDRHGVRQTDSRCLIGSVKSNIGHLEAAAGCAGIFKVLLAMRHRWIPASLHVDQLNPQIQLEGSPFAIATEGQAWEARQDADRQTKTRLAGVSSFGFGGVNAHVVLEEYPADSPGWVEKDRPQWIILSARDEQRLRLTAARLAAALSASDAPPSLAAIAYTLQTGRDAAVERLAFLSDDVAGAAKTLAAFANSGMIEQTFFRGTASKRSVSPVSVSFASAGEHWVNGGAVDWRKFYSIPPRLVSLPGSAFLRERYWFVKSAQTPPKTTISTAPAYLERIWQPAPLTASEGFSGTVHLIGGTPEEQSTFAQHFGKLTVSLKEAPEAVIFLRPDLATWRTLAQDAAQRPQVGVRWLLVQDHSELDPSFEMLDGIGRAVVNSSPRSAFVSLRADGLEQAALAAQCSAELATALPGLVDEILVAGGTRFRKVNQPLTLAERSPFVFRAGAVYVLSGGLGSLGFALARRMVKSGARVALLGRSALGSQQKDLVQELRRSGGQAIYCQANVGEPKELAAALQVIRGQGGPIYGVVHAAGVLGQSTLATKPESEWDAVLGVKVQGAIALDITTAHDPLDFFVLYSSLAAVTGDLGHGDYAAANRFLDAFALRRAERGPGRTLSVGWGLWREGGLGSAAHLSDWEQSTGLRALATEAALDSLEDLLASAATHVLVVAGDLSGLLHPPVPNAARKPEMLPPTAASKSQFSRPVLEEYLLRRIGQHLQLPPGTLSPTSSLQEYGLDSILLNQLVNVLATEIAPVPKSLLLEQDTVAEIADYLLEYHVAAVQARLTAEVPAATPVLPNQSQPIAIVGLAGRYPGARSLDDFWDNFCAGRSVIGNLPLSRWQGVTEHDSRNWQGAFLEDVAAFDPVFFGISAAVAHTMKPEERILMELAVDALETAGYPISSPLCKQTGVYMGVTANTYPLLAQDQADATVPLDTSLFGLANRISHALHCEGPSLTMDTGCCSALTAIHLACEALASGAIKMALAGAANLILHPSKYRLLENGNLIAPEAHAGLFPAGGAGFIPGEGAGIVVLKTLSQAEADGDFIWGVIAGSTLTHKGGQQNYQMPSPRAAKEHLTQLLTRSGIKPNAINFVELQALGAELADASEWSALVATLGKEAQPCPVGSVKLGIGHLEAASGMAQLTKVLLQLRYGQIPPSPLAPQLNPEVQPTLTRFFFPETVMPWDTGTQPRCALISASGVGGALASLVVTEFPAPVTRPEVGQRNLLVLSAKSEAQLRQRLADLVAFLQKAKPWPALSDVAFTLQQGRESYRYRWAAVIEDLTELQSESLRMWQGRVRSEPVEVSPTTLEEAAAAWVEGAAIPERFGSQGRRVPLPTYPFERLHCWINSAESGAVPPPDRGVEGVEIVAGYYNRVTQTLSSAIGDRDVHLVFAPFPEKLPGFSWLLTFFEPDTRREHYAHMLEAQRELKRVLVRHIDWTQTRRLLDIGCGLATDLLQLAREHPHLQAVGYTITPKQVELGRQRIQSAGLAQRVEVFHRDSTHDEFPGEFDAALGFEVLFHIRDKSAVFNNLSRHLRPGGLFVVADCVANTVTDINRDSVGLFTSRASQLAEVLGNSGMEIISCVDVGQEMSNFLDDERFEENLAYVASHYPEMVYAEPEHRAWHNCGKAFALGLIRYVLLTIRYSPELTPLVLQERNLACLQSPISYADAVREMQTPKSVITDLQALRQLTAEVLGTPVGRIEDDVPLAEYGVDSLVGLKLIDTINRRYGLELEMATLFDCPTVQSLGRRIAQERPVMPVSVAQSRDHPRPPDEAIAVIGMAGRFPGAPDIEAFWENLAQGVDAVTDIPADRWDTSRFYDPDPNQLGRSYSRWGGFVNDVDKFDAGFFRITRAEAEVMDPQQRLFLETCWEALEHAGHAHPALRGSTCGVIAGVFNNDYQMLLSKADGVSHLGHAMLGNADAILASRISYFLDLKGPALCVDSACSSSLVAIHLACQSLRNRDADMMLAGGVTLYLDETPYLMMSKAGMLSPTGRCRSFSAEADGITTGEAVGVVVLKRLADALADGDCIHGVIRGSGLNQDGQTNGITAPSRESQIALLCNVYRTYGINPETIGYLEAHGTGTKLGDPVEVAALTEAFRKFTSKEGFCALGSVKSNIGHTSAASGVTGLIKVLQAMRHGLIPPTLHVEVANPLLHLEGSPFVLATEARPWLAPHRAAISAFGFSGTNCHLVVDGPPELPVVGSDRESVIPLSAATPAQLREIVSRLREWLRQNPALRVCDIAWTWQCGRTPLVEQLQIVAANSQQLMQQLDAYLSGVAAPGVHVDGTLPLSEPPADVRRVPLPTYPFARERYWFHSSPIPQPSGSEMPPTEMLLRIEDEVLVREHTIFGRHCLPTDALLDLVYRHALVHRESGSLRIRDVTLFAPLFCTIGEATRLFVETIGDPVSQIAITSRVDSRESEPQRHLTAAIECETDARPEPPTLPIEPPALIIDGASLHQPGQALYVGEFFRSLRQISFWPGRARAQLLLSESARRAADRFALHPGLLDAFFGLAHSLAIQTVAASDAAYIPLCIQDVQVFEPLRESEYQCDLRVVHTSQEFLRFDGELIDTRNQVAIAIRGLDYRRVLASMFAEARPAPTTLPKLRLKPVAVAPEESIPVKPLVVTEPSSSAVTAPTQERLQTLLAEVLLCPPSTINPKQSLVEQGVDSILGLEFVQRLNREFGLHLQGTILFEHPTLDKLATQLGAVEPYASPPAEVWSSGVGEKEDSSLSPSSFPPTAFDHIPPAPASVPPLPELKADLQEELTALFAQTLLVTADSIQPRQSLIEQGADSILGLEFVQSINRKFGLHLPGTVLFEHPTIESLSIFLSAQLPAPATTSSMPQDASAVLHKASPPESESGIAIIGMAGRFPGAQTLDELWENLAANRYLISEVPIDHWDFRPYFGLGDERRTMYCNRGGFLSGVDQFDPLFFNISPREAQTMDPQLRIFLEVLWETFEDAGYAAHIRGTRTGLYLGNCYNDYLDLMKQQADLDFQFAGSGNSNSMLSNRASFFFDLTGPCLTLDTACSSSLVAVHLAMQALRRGECDMAIAGGVNLNLSPAKYLNFCAIGAFSRSGEIRPFSGNADGYLPGEGVAALLLKPLTAALRDGDRIHGVLRGSAVRCAGRSAGPTVPNPALETATLVDAWHNAQIAPDTLTYLEAHGTGTKLGDPLEINAIRRAFATFTQKTSFCHLGTVKANFGHTEATAGVAGIIKTLLQMRHRTITGMPNLLPLNSMIEMDGSPLILEADTRPWETDGGSLRRAGVSSFGMGGTYAHVVLEEFPTPLQVRTFQTAPQTLILSARTPEALQESARRLAVFLEEHPEVVLSDVAFTLRKGRECMEQSFSIVASTVADAAAQLHLASRELPSSKPSPQGEEIGEGWLIGLPFYPFEHQRYWLPTALATQAASTPQLMLDWQAIARRDGLVFRYKVSPDDPVVAQHRVREQRFLPGTASLGLAMEAAVQLLPDEAWQLQDVVWQAPVNVTEQPMDLTLRVEPQKSGWQFELSSDRVHVSGGIHPDGDAADPTLDLVSWRERSTQTIPGEELYRAFATVGIDYGPCFRSLRSVHIGEQFSLGEWVAAPGTPEAAIFDAALQAVSPLLDSRESVLLPWSVRRVVRHRALPESGYCLVLRQEATRFVIALCDLEGKVGLQLTDFCVRALPSEPVPVNDIVDDLYETVWQPEVLKVNPVERPKPTLIVSFQPDSSLVSAVAQRAADSPVVQLSRLDSDAAFADALAKVAGLGEVWFLAEMNSTAPVATVAEELTVGLYRLVRALLSAGLGQTPLRLRIVTQQANAVLPGETVLPQGAGLFGLSRSIANEFPRWTVSCVDIDAASLRSVLVPALSAEPAIAPGEERAYRQGQRWIRRLRQASLGHSQQLPLRRGGIYLIAGGAQGLGFETARWLSREYQPKLILLGRRPLANPIWDRISELEREGAEAFYVRADLCNLEVLQRALQLGREQFGPIEGVIHSAMVLRDGLLASMDEQTFRAALAPKMTGLENLREALRGDPLEVALLFSSVQSQLGNAGQGNYAAASTFADSFAALWRNEVSYPVKVVNWSYWGTVGAVATPDYRQRMEAAGVHSIEPAAGMRILRQLLASQQFQQLWVLKASARFLRLVGVSGDESLDETVYPEKIPSLLRRSLLLLQEKNR
jgi:acyl transferase domain-containing protein/acyl carrier protein/SAM-dependent methyltransferase